MSANKTSSPIFIGVILKKSTVEKIRKIALVSGKSTHDTTLMLISVAIKYNYTKDFHYIPCKPQSEGNISLTPKKEPSYQINLFVSPSLTKKLSSIMELNLCESKSSMLRSLIETALIYDYDENLFFHAPQKLFSSTSSYNNRSNDIIMLDII